MIYDGYDCYHYGLTVCIVWNNEYPWDGTTSWIFTMIISPLCGVAQTPDCGMFVISFSYKPFMWRRSDARLWHVCYSIFFISPLCGIAQTLDWGMFVISFSHKPFMRRRSDARLWHACYFIYFISPLRGVAKTPDWGMLTFTILSRRRFRHSIGAFYFYSVIAYSGCI